jgi:hypothetical protein
MGFGIDTEHAQCASVSPVSKLNKCGEIVYVNYEYGFTFTLPHSWKGFSVMECRWGGGDGERETDQGPLIVIRHPLYTEDNPREDIPIMVFTRDQWRAVDEGNLIVSAAPIAPGEIGRNKKYVFALPPRFSYDDLEGVHEVLDIVESNPLRAARIRQVTHARRTSH